MTYTGHRYGGTLIPLQPSCFVSQVMRCVLPLPSGALIPLQLPEDRGLRRTLLRFHCPLAR